MFQTELVASIGGQLVEYWKQAFRAAPRSTVLATIAAALIGATGAYVQNARYEAEQERLRVVAASYSTQIRQLDQTQEGLRALMLFVQRQREQLIELNKNLDALRHEREALRPLLEADRKSIDALFAQQEARNQRAQRKERWIGFGFGILSSLIASVLWYVSVSRLKKFSKRPAA